MNYYVPVYWIVFVVLAGMIALCDIKYNMLKCVSASGTRPYSWGRVQLAWWMLIVLSAFVTIICCSPGNQIPALNSSTVILLGITSGTTIAANLIDQSDIKNPNIPVLIQDLPKQGFFLDILSDSNGVTVHRLQTVLLNFIFGAWFVVYVLKHFTDPCSALHPALAECASQPWSYIIPEISTNNLVLLGLSSATYAALKTTENTPTVAAALTTKPTTQSGQTTTAGNHNQQPQPNLVAQPTG
jgi:hypothetical protein